ncbi:MAG: lipopolysaccharide heptosyltransferase II [Candidatus Glassbacteria bacterium]
MKIRKETATDAPAILVVRFSSIGDVLLATPVLRAIKSRWPGARVTFLTRERFAPLLAGNPHVDEVVSVDQGAGLEALREACRTLQERKWHLLVDLHGSLRSRLVSRLVRADCKVRYSNLRFRRTLLIYTRLDFYGKRVPSVAERYAACLRDFGIELDEKGCELVLGERDHEEADNLIRLAWPDRVDYLAVAPGAAWPVKRWPAERFAEAARRIAERRGWKVVILGGSDDREACAEVAGGLDPGLCLDLAGRLSLRGSAAAVAGAKLLLTNDTSLMHIATAVGTPVTAVFGPTVRQFGYFPYRAKEARVVEADIWCRPCTHNGRMRCPLGHFRCMRGIGKEEVVRAMIKLTE